MVYNVHSEMFSKADDKKIKVGRRRKREDRTQGWKERTHVKVFQSNFGEGKTF
jgi:hypothetical protein